MSFSVDQMIQGVVQRTFIIGKQQKTIVKIVRSAAGIILSTPSSGPGTAARSLSSKCKLVLGRDSVEFFTGFPLFAG
jgi:hypothetical protein